MVGILVRRGDIRETVGGGHFSQLGRTMQRRAGKANDAVPTRFVSDSAVMVASRRTGMTDGGCDWCQKTLQCHLSPATRDDPSPSVQP